MPKKKTKAKKLGRQATKRKQKKKKATQKRKPQKAKNATKKRALKKRAEKPPAWNMKEIEVEAKTNILIRDALKLFKDNPKNKNVQAGARALIQAERRAQLKKSKSEMPKAPTPADPSTLPPPSIPTSADPAASALASPLPPASISVNNPTVNTTTPANVPKFNVQIKPALVPNFANAQLAAKVKQMPEVNPVTRETEPRYWGPLCKMESIPDERYEFDWHCFGKTRKTGEPCGNLARFGAAWDGVCAPLLMGFPYCEKHLSQYGGPEMVSLYCKLATPSQAARFAKNNGPKKFQF